ncbi:competence protein CoiA [Robertmurraya sp. Marseille-Q9965]
MLTAKFNSGETISLAEDYTRNQLEEIRKKEEFYCRSCSEKMILKIGTQRIPHFAHEKGSECTEYDRESEYHMSGKIKLFEWLKIQGLSPEMECYYPTIKQRADIAFTYEGKTFCIEFQCCTISAEVFRKRTEGYRKLSLHPIWILGGKNINRKQTYKLSLTSFHFLFLQETANHEVYLPAYCPQTNQFIYLENLISLTTRTAYASIFCKTLEKLKVHELIAPKLAITPPLRNWGSDLFRYKNTLITSGQALQDPFLFELYTHALHPHTLPSYVGLPLKQNYAIETAPFIWQTYLFLEHIYGQESGTIIRFQDVYKTILKRLKEKQLVIRDLPCLHRNPLPFVIQEYLVALSQIGVLKKKENNIYFIDKQIKIANNMEERLKEEERVRQEYYEN